MIAVFVVLAAVALAAAGATGWMMCARGASGARTSLTESAASAEMRAAAADARLAEATTRLETQTRELAEAREAAMTARGELRDSQAALTTARDTAATADKAATAARAALVETTSQVAAQKAEISALRERLSAADESGRARDTRAVAEVQRVLAPLMERERLGSELARLEIGRGTRGELPRLMDAIAKIGDFSTVVLSDECGLPLAYNNGSTDGETLSGLWSMLLAIADRVATSGGPVPQSIVVHDAANQTMLHRLFDSGGARFLLTAVSRGRSLPPEALDPALGKLERILAGSVLAAS